MTEKARISVILPKKACQEIREQMMREGYTLREKSKWYSEAIDDFLKIHDFENYVELASFVDELSKVETLYIPLIIDQALEMSIIQVRKRFPGLEGVKSLIVRASIIQKLLSRTPRNV